MKHQLFILSSLIFAATVHSEVNESSGNMVLSQALCEVKGTTISLPLSLYYASGITIDQRASWVGLGFDLSLPYIERIPQGSADEKAAEFHCNGHPTDRVEPWFFSNRNYDKLITETGNGYTSAPDSGNFTNQQDYYHLSAPFASGRIIFGQPANNETPMVAYLQNWRPVKIEYRISESDDIYRWEVTDETGVKYVFGGTEGVVTATANMEDGEWRENTVRTFSGIDNEWITTTVTETGCRAGPDCKKTVPVVTSDHYVNSSFNIRWYLTEIISPNNGESIKITYTPHDKKYSVWIQDLFYTTDITEQKGATSLFRFRQDDHDYASFSFGQDNYHLYPVYPVDIIGPTGKVHFTFGNASDIVVQGDKRLESMELYTRASSLDNDYRLASRFRMSYGSAGLSSGHPYSVKGGGRTQLTGVWQYAQDNCRAYPLCKFEYPSNPGFGKDGYLCHDFYGYYRNDPLTREGDEYRYPVGQCQIGTPQRPGAEAWSIQRVVYPDGKVVEYTYEPSVATFSSINKPVSSNDNTVMPGIRVAQERVFDGVTSTPIITTYTYDNGYIGYRSAIGTDINEFYATINAGAYKTIRNIMVLSGTGVQYGYCRKEQNGSGSVASYYLTPADNLPVYEAESPKNLSLADVEVSESHGLNNLAHCRGGVYKTEYWNSDTPPKVVAKTEVSYAVKYDQFSYTFEEAEAKPLGTCVTGGLGGSAAPVETADNQRQCDNIGFIRVMNTITTTDGNVQAITENVSYNHTNGLADVVRTTNSDGTQLLTKTSYAFEQAAYASGMGVEGAHMLAQPCQTVVYAKVGDGNTSLSGADARSSGVTTWTNTFGTWLPASNYVWSTAMDNSGSPKNELPEFPFSNPSSRNTDWKFTGGVTRYTASGLPLENESAINTPSATVYSPVTALPVAFFTNAHYGYCIFTNYTDNGIVSAAGDVRVSCEPQDVHFSPTTLKITTSGSDDQYYRTQPCEGVSGSTLAGKTFVWEFWAKADRNTTSATFLQLESGGWTSVQYYDLTTTWQKYRFTATVSEDATGSQYRVVVRPPHECNGTYTEGTIFFDDIRAYPEHALASHIYYDPACRNPVLSVDANNNPGTLTNYDGFGRPLTEYRIDKTKSRGEEGADRLLNRKMYALSGAVYALRSHANQLYVSAPSTTESLIANASSVQATEKFSLLDMGYGVVAIMSVAHQQYVCAESKGSDPLIADRKKIGLWETFELINLGEGKIALRALANQHYVCAESQGKEPLVANQGSDSNAIGSWETFDLIPQ